MHELQVGGCRLDVAFVQPAHLIGVEIKSERDNLGRLARQIRHYTAEIPEVWIAYAPRWEDGLDKLIAETKIPWGIGQIILVEGGIRESFRYGPYERRREAEPRPMLTAPMLHLLWRSEIGILAQQHGIRLPSRVTLPKALPILARRLTGDQIVEGVCTMLRARVKTGGFAADPAITPAGRQALADREAQDDQR